MIRLKNQLILILVTVFCLNPFQAVWASSDSLIFLNKELYSDTIRAETATTTPDQMFLLGNEPRILAEHPLQERPLLAAGLNLLPIFGAGSHQQGDLQSGLILGILDGLSWGSLILGFTPLGANYQWGTYFIISSVGFLIGRIFGFIAPFVYSEHKQETDIKSVSQDQSIPNAHIVKVQWQF